jgi:dTDP-4-amino-4,6-dideoxygalactose transaminase
MTILTIPHFGLKRQYTTLKDELLQATDNVLSKGILIGGEYTREFEQWLAKKTWCRFATVTHSGTQALEFIAQYVSDQDFLNGNPDNPKIILPNLSYPATLNAFLSNGWEVELVDTDSHGCMSFDTLERTDDQTYSCYVGLYGVEAPTYFTNWTIVDGAQHWLQADGNVGAGMAISFDPTKNLNASGNGGAVVTNDEGLYNFVNKAKNNGKPEYDYRGTNSKMSEIDCAHLLVRTKYIEEWQIRRRFVSDTYIENFADMPFRCLSKGIIDHADQKFVIYTERRDELHAYLNEHGVESKIHYPYTLSDLPVATGLVKPDMMSVSMMLSRGVLSLPIYPELTDDEIYYIIKQVKDFFAK